MQFFFIDIHRSLKTAVQDNLALDKRAAMFYGLCDGKRGLICTDGKIS